MPQYHLQQKTSQGFGSIFACRQGSFDDVKEVDHVVVVHVEVCNVLQGRLAALHRPKLFENTTFLEHTEGISR